MSETASYLHLKVMGVDGMPVAEADVDDLPSTQGLGEQVGAMASNRHAVRTVLQALAERSRTALLRFLHGDVTEVQAAFAARPARARNAEARGCWDRAAVAVAARDWHRAVELFDEAEARLPELQLPTNLERKRQLARAYVARDERLTS